MKVETLNNFLRTLFKNLINDGYKKRHICSLILSSQAEPQLEGFLQGRDFGIKPLTKIIDAFGYDLYLVVVPKEDQEIRNNINEANNQVLQDCKSKLINALNQNFANNGRRKKSSELNIISDIIDQILNKEE